MIKSTDSEVRELAAALGSEDAALREAAVARLNIIGSRAVARLIATYTATPSLPVKLGVLTVLETSADERALPLVHDALAHGGDLALAAVAILRKLLQRTGGPEGVEALDILLGLARDASADRRVRAAAADALEGAPDDVRRAVRRELASSEPPALAVWAEATDGRLPDDPATLRDALDEAEHAALPAVHRVLVAVRAREEDRGAQARRAQWREIRGALHAVLAARGSRIALYDLREELERTAERLPRSFIQALSRLGEDSCLEAIATALHRAPQRDLQWRHDLIQAFGTIAARKRLTSRHAAMRRALAKAPELRRA